LTAKLNVHEERLNRQEEMTETTAYQIRQVTAPMATTRRRRRRRRRRRTMTGKRK